MYSRLPCSPEALRALPIGDCLQMDRAAATQAAADRQASELEAPVAPSEALAVVSMLLIRCARSGGCVMRKGADYEVRLLLVLPR